MTDANKDFTDYFETTREHPSSYIRDSGEILPLGELWCYMNSSFINGFLNICSDKPPISAFVLGRYRYASKAIERDKSYWYQDPPNSLNWVEVPPWMTKRQLYELMTQEGRVYHTKLDMFADDILLLFSSTMNDGRICYWFFWLDMDCSDCCIGRFVTADPEVNVQELFRSYVFQRNNENSGHHQPWELPPHFFNGWISF